MASDTLLLRLALFLFYRTMSQSLLIYPTNHLLCPANTAQYHIFLFGWNMGKEKQMLRHEFLNVWNAYVKLLHKSSIINRVKFELLAVFYMWILQRTYTANCKSLLPTGFESHQCLSYLHLRAYSTKEGYSLKLPLVQCWLHLQLQKILSVRKKNSF